MTESHNSNVFKTIWESTREDEVAVPGGGITAVLTFVSGVILITVAISYREYSWLVLPGSWLFSLALLISMANSRFEKQKRHREWAAKGDFQIIEAEVETVKTHERGHKGSARTLRTIRVGSLEFMEPDDLSYPFKGLSPGAYVRITHNGQEVLKVEVRAE